MKLGVLASGAGTTLQAVLDAEKSGAIAVTTSVVISNNGGSGALERARHAGVAALHLSGVTHPQPETLDRAIAQALREHGAELVLLAGYMKKLGPHTLGAYRGRIVNTHPALLPKFGGQGMYGMRVHSAVLAAGEAVTGVTIHLVEGEYDTGPTIAQATVPVVSGDTPDTLAARVQRSERELLVETLGRIAAGTLALPPLPPARRAADP